MKLLFLKIFPFFSLLLVLTACSGEHSNSFRALKTAALISQSDTNPHYWFSKTNRVTGENDPVMLLFGYAENGNVCDLLATALKEDYPEQNFQCSQVIP